MKERSERRKESRKKKMASIQVYNNDIGIHIGYIRDLTLQVAQVVSEKCLDVDTRIALALELPGSLPEVIATRMTISARLEPSRCSWKGTISINK